MKNKLVNASIAAFLACGLTFTALPASASTPTQVHPAGTKLAEASTASYGQCVLNFTGFGALFGASEGTILGYINRKDWNKAAQTMVKFLGKQAVKGGVVGLAASLAAAGAWCATPWAK